MTDDILHDKATEYLRSRVLRAVSGAAAEVRKWLIVSQAADTDHASHCDQFARALIHDVVCEMGRPTYCVSGCIDNRACPTLQEIGAKMARKAAAKAMQQFEESPDNG